MNGSGEPDAGAADKGRSWREVRAEAFERHPELDSAQARLDRARVRAEYAEAFAEWEGTRTPPSG